jgi:serine/threonine protein kinase/Flp pilus assembly protein TadD
MECSDQRGKKDVDLVSDARDRPQAQLGSDGPVFSPGEVIGDRYRVIRFIARGGMGEVYEVEDSEFQARIALKTISPDRASSSKQIARFRQEIQLSRKVGHRNVCRVFDLGRHKDDTRGDVLFLTMELLQGQTLTAYLHTHGSLSCDEALPLIRQMVAALSAAHQLGIVHRDFKPGNVMLEETAHGTLLKVTDFGLATNPEADQTISSSFTEVVGTPEYMAPEQLRGHCSNRTDVYGLGVTVFQMLCGRLPAASEAPFKGPESGTGKRIGQRWRDAISKCLAPYPADRFASVEEFWCALSGESLTERLGWKTIAAGVRRHWVIYGVAAAVLLAAIALLLTGVVPNPFRPLPREKHIAVLSFANIGNDAYNQAFTDGVAESLTSKLSQLERYQKSFWVVPASDARNVKSLDEAYRNLNVTLAVTGSIEHTAEGLNLTANLVDPQNHRQLASRSLHLTSTNLDEMQQRVWESVADMLDLQISSQVKQELAAGGTSQPAAYDLYERGNGFLQRYDLEDVDQAIALFNQALAKDSGYALAYAGLGHAYSTKYTLTKDPEWIAQATHNAGRAVELNASLLPVRETLARVYQETGQLDKALVEYQRVLEQDPTVIDAEYSVGEIYDAQGKYSQAEAAYKNAIARRSTYWQGYCDLGALYYRLGRFAEAAEQFRSVIDLAPDSAVGYYNLGGAYAAMGRYEDAVGVLQKGLSIKPNADAWTNLGSAYMYMGKYEEAVGAMKEAADLNPHDHTLWRNLGDSYHQIPSRQEEARQAYQKALDTATTQLKINPNDIEALSGIALYDGHLGHNQDAETYIIRALALSPKNSDTLFTSVLVYELIGHREQALQAVDAAVTAGYSLDEVEKEPELRALRSDARYQRWLRNRREKSTAS